MGDRQEGSPHRGVGGEDRLHRNRLGRHDAQDRVRRLTLLDRRLLFVTGKGGVGKTTAAAALAELAASLGKRTLVCEMDAKGSLSTAFDVGPLGFAPTQVGERLWAMQMNTEDSLREYLRLFVRIPLVARIGPLARTFDFVADAAPGVKEILAVGKLCYEVRERHYDLVVVDAEASGHIVAQIAAPTVIRQLVQVGLVRDQTDWMLEILDDAACTGLVVVTTPEEMPVVETIELIDRVHRETKVDVAAVVANRVLPALFSERELEVFGRLQSPAARAEVVALGGREATTVLDAAALNEARRQVGAGHLERLRRALDPRTPLLAVPELFTRATGRRVVTLMAEAIHDEVA
ncbi:MAG: ArsA family ATPase [Actinomycetota bacterium]